LYTPPIQSEGVAPKQAATPFVAAQANEQPSKIDGPKQVFSPFSQPTPFGVPKEASNKPAEVLKQSFSPFSQSSSFGNTDRPKQSFSPFGSKPKGSSDTLYTPPSQKETVDSIDRSSQSTSFTPQVSQSPFVTTQGRQGVPATTASPDTVIPQNDISSRMRRDDEQRRSGPSSTNNQQFPGATNSKNSVSPFGGSQEPPQYTAETDSTNAFLNTPSPTTNNLVPTTTLKPRPELSEADSDVKITFDTGGATNKPLGSHPGSLPSSVNSVSLPMNTPQRPNKPFAASAMPKIDVESAGRSGSSIYEQDSTSTRVTRSAPRRSNAKLFRTPGSANVSPPSQSQSMPSPRVSAPVSPTQQQKQPQQQHQEQDLPPQERIRAAILSADDKYIPSDVAVDADVPDVLIREVEGATVQDYDPTPQVYKGVDVNVQTSVSIPIKVAVPGSVVTYTIEKKTADFMFGISSRSGLGQTETVKVRRKNGFVLKFPCVFSHLLLYLFLSLL
jgi:hypothetical protein